VLTFLAMLRDKSLFNFYSTRCCYFEPSLRTFFPPSITTFCPLRKLAFAASPHTPQNGPNFRLFVCFAKHFLINSKANGDGGEHEKGIFRLVSPFAISRI
jgi:hypothetical protein